MPGSIFSTTLSTVLRRNKRHSSGLKASYRQWIVIKVEAGWRRGRSGGLGIEVPGSRPSCSRRRYSSRSSVNIVSASVGGLIGGAVGIDEILNPCSEQIMIGSVLWKAGGLTSFLIYGLRMWKVDLKD